MGEHRTVSVFISLAAMGAAEVNGILGAAFNLIAANGRVQPLPYSYPDLPGSFSPRFMEKHSFPTDYILGLCTAILTASQSSRQRWSVGRHDVVPSVVNCLRRTVTAVTEQQV